MFPRRRRKRRGPNPKYWWIWAIGIVLIILLAQKVLPGLIMENAQNEEQDLNTQIEAEADIQTEAEDIVEIPESENISE